MLRLHIHLPHGFCQIFRLGIQGFQIRFALLQNEFCGSIVGLCLLCLLRELLQLRKPDRNFQTTHLIPEDQIFLRLFRLLPQGFHLKLQLRDLVVDAKQIVRRMLQLPLGLFLAMTVLGNTGSFLKDLTAVCGFCGQDLINTSLTDVAVAFFTKTGVHEHLIDVTKPGSLAIDVIFAVTGAVIPPGHHDLIGLHLEGMLRVVQDQADLRKSHLGPLQGTAEDHVLHLTATEGLGAHLTHDPADGIGNIRFAAAVGANDGGDVTSKGHDGLIREGFESLDFNCL